jgi:hypothetical protein
LRAERAEQELQTTKDLSKAMTRAKEEVDRNLSASSRILLDWKIVLLDRLLGHPVNQWSVVCSGIGDFSQILAKEAEM